MSHKAATVGRTAVIWTHPTARRRDQRSRLYGDWRHHNISARADSTGVLAIVPATGTIWPTCKQDSIAIGLT